MNERSSDIISNVMLFVADYLTMFSGVELRVMLFPEPDFIPHETKIRLFIF